MNQLKDNFLRQGKGNIGQGSITTSWITAFNQVGIVPEEVYTGINYDSNYITFGNGGVYDSYSQEAVNMKVISSV